MQRELVLLLCVTIAAANKIWEIAHFHSDIIYNRFETSYFSNDLCINETITYHFISGTFSTGYRKIRLRDRYNVRLVQVQDHSDPSTTFSTTPSKNSFRIDYILSKPVTESCFRTISFIYTVRGYGMYNIYPLCDTADFQVVDHHWEVPIRKVSFSMWLPYPSISISRYIVNGQSLPNNQPLQKKYLPSIAGVKPFTQLEYESDSGLAPKTHLQLYLKFVPILDAEEGFFYNRVRNIASVFSFPVTFFVGLFMFFFLLKRYRPPDNIHVVKKDENESNINDGGYASDGYASGGYASGGYSSGGGGWSD
jgi:uncharacterized membrane protein YgcG